MKLYYLMRWLMTYNLVCLHLTFARYRFTYSFSYSSNCSCRCLWYPISLYSQLYFFSLKSHIYILIYLIASVFHSCFFPFQYSHHILKISVIRILGSYEETYSKVVGSSEVKKHMSSVFTQYVCLASLCKHLYFCHN